MQMIQMQPKQDRPDTVFGNWLQARQRGRVTTALAQKASFNTIWQNLKKWNPKLKSTETQEKFFFLLLNSYYWLEMMGKLFHLKPIVAQDSTDEKHNS